MRDADDRSEGDLREARNDILDGNGADPFTAGFDHVLGAVGDLHEALRIDGSDVARIKVAVLVQNVLLRGPIVPAGDTRSAHHQTAERRTVVFNRAIHVVDQAHVYAERGASLLQAPGDLLLERQARDFYVRRADTTQWRHLRHSPAVQHFHTKSIVEAANQVLRTGSTPNHD